MQLREVAYIRTDMIKETYFSFTVVSFGGRKQPAGKGCT